MLSTLVEHCKFVSQDLTGKIATIFRCHFIRFLAIQEMSACNSLKTGYILMLVNKYHRDPGKQI